MTDITDDNRQPWRQSEDVGTPISVRSVLAIYLTALIDTVVAWQQRISQRHHLSGLDDRLLKDMGLSRADVDNEVSKPFWRL